MSLRYPLSYRYRSAWGSEGGMAERNYTNIAEALASTRPTPPHLMGGHDYRAPFDQWTSDVLAVERALGYEDPKFNSGAFRRYIFAATGNRPLSE